MSFLFPLYLLGMAAVAVPVILHLRRRPPRDRTDFSSLMFLEASPLERKSCRRLENLLVLLLRCALIGLLAFLFARPLFRGEGLAGSGADGRFIVVLLDRSASMRREDLWEQALGRARDAAGSVRTQDRLALVAFDASAQLVIGFDDWESEEPPRRGQLLAGRLEELRPGWGSTDLGSAIALAAELVEEARSAARTGAGGETGPGDRAPGEILLLSDLQEGADRRALEAAAWPANTTLVVDAPAPREPGNASLHLLASESVITLRGEGGAAPPQADAQAEGALRLRLSNEATSLDGAFRISWEGREEGAVECALAPGAQRTFRMALPEGGAILELHGDAHDFDNRVYLVAQSPRPLRVVCLGGDAGKDGDPASPFFYIERAVQATNVHAPLVRRDIPEGLGLAEAADFVVVSGEVADGLSGEIKSYIERGGTALLVLSSADQGDWFADLSGAGEFRLTEVDPAAGYALLEGIVYEDPLLRAFADPQVRDFSKVRFWRYRKPQGDGQWPEAARVLARFDTGDAAWLALPIGEGQMVVFTSGWHPADSQLGLSTKFVPLLYSLLEESGAEDAAGAGQFVVGEALPVAAGALVRRPDATEEHAGSGGLYTRADMPGIYRVLAGGDGERVFAVNLDHRESRTAPVAIERLEEAGVVLRGDAATGAPSETTEEAPERKRYMLDVEREKRQQFWRWLVFGAIVVVFLEMLAAGRKPQPRAGPVV